MRVVNGGLVPEMSRMGMRMGADNCHVDDWRSHVHNEQGKGESKNSLTPVCHRRLSLQVSART